MMEEDRGASGSAVGLCFNFLSLLQEYYLIGRARQRRKNAMGDEEGVDATVTLWDKNNKRAFVCSRKLVILGDNAINRNIKGG